MPELRLAQEEGTRPNCYFYHIQDGYHYHQSEKRQGTTYYKCVFAGRGCRGRAIFEAVNGFVHTSVHNHDRDPVYPEEMALRRNILRRCEGLEYTSLPRFEEGRQLSPEAVARVTYARMRTPMRNARLRRYPTPLPTTVEELSAILQDPQYQVLTMSDDGLDNIYAGSVTDTDGCHHIMFISQRMLGKAREFTVIHSDGTFRAVPSSADFADQIFCLVAVWNYHIISLGWVLMTRRTEVAYTAVLQLFRRLLGHHIELTRVITDFETAQLNAWANVFNVRTQGCLWHLCRAFIQEVAKLNLINRMRRVEEVKKVIRLTMGLPLLPEHLIVNGFLVILRHAQNEGNYIFQIVRPYLTYVWRRWVKRPWRRNCMTVYGSKQRTNNACESQNRTLREEVGTHSNVYKFIGGLVRLEQKSYNIVLSLENFRRVSRARKRSSVYNDQRVQLLSEELFNPPGPIDVTILRFLSAATHTMDNMVDELILDRLGRRQ